MPITAKLFYFQRRRPPPSPVESTDNSLRRDSPDVRRQVHPIRSAHHRPGYEVTRGSQRDCGASNKSITEPTRNMLFSSGLNTSTSNDRLPDVVQQAKERLHQRLRSVDLFLGRQPAPAVGTVWAGPHLSSESDICTSKDCSLDSLTIRFNSSTSLSSHNVKQVPVGKLCTTAGVVPHLRPALELGQETLQGTMEGDDVESSVDCSICLEGCHSSGEGLVQLQCKHIFHLVCLERWLQSRADCPYCRSRVMVPRKEWP